MKIKRHPGSPEAASNWKRVRDRKFPSLGLHQMGDTLIVEGTLRGMGCEVPCLLIATRSESANAMFTRCAVLEAPRWLPDGYYEATFSGQSAFLHRLNGAWSVGVPWRQHQPAASVEFPRAISARARRRMETTNK